MQKERMRCEVSEQAHSVVARCCDIWRGPRKRWCRAVVEV